MTQLAPDSWLLRAGRVWHRRALLATFGVVGLVATGFGLWSIGWPQTAGAGAGLFVLPSVLLAISLGLWGAVFGSAAAAAFLFWLGQGAESTLELSLISTYIAGATLGVAAFSHQQSEHRRRLDHALTHDPGTGLPGRLALWRALEEPMAARETGQSRDGLAVITIENLQDITATFGYESADQLIGQLWQRLADIFHPGAGVYHYHRERLAVLFHDPGRDLEVLTTRLEERLEASILYEGIPVHFTSRIGVVRLNGHDIRAVISQAEAAIEVARERGVQSLVFTSGMERDRKRALILLGDLQTAKQDGSLRMHYQPKLRLATLELLGFEALARWEHPVLGAVSPAEFIPIVERTECIHGFSVWATQRVLAQLHGHWPHARPAISVAVNISSHNLMNPEFPAQVRALLDQHRLPPSVLELEVTESEIMRDPKRAIEVLGQLAEIPIVIAIDDFGTGYSSLAYLHRLPATTIKLDRMFISKMNHDDGVKTIVSAAIDLAHRLDMRVVAEGIETADQVDTLVEMGCDFGQGFFFSRPLPFEDAVHWRPAAGSGSLA